MSQINVMNLTFAYDGSWDNIFESVSFSIDTDWKLGFSGRNGRGKTTFLKLLTGQFEYQGKISSTVNFEYFPFEIKDKSKNTIDIIEEINPDYEFWKLCRELSFLKVSEDVLFRSFETLSNGEQTKILLATLFLKENNFLLIDEPTNHLDFEGREIVANYLNNKYGFILVSHDRAFLDSCIDHVLSINKTNIEVQKGNFSSWYQNKEYQDNFEMSENEKLKRDIKRLDKASKQTADWSHKVESTKNGIRIAGLRPDKGHIGRMAAKMMKRSICARNRKQNAIEEKSKLLKNIETSDNLKLHPLIYPKSKLIEVSDLAIFYGEKQVCEKINFTVNSGDRIALQGKNGSGKSSVLKLIFGEEIDYTGNLMRASGLKISYVSQNTSHLMGNLSEFAMNHSLDESLFKAILRKLNFSRTQFEKNIQDFSEGQKKKVLITKSLCEEAYLYIWDEPLNFIDVLSRIQIEELILKYKPTLLFVEHDKIFTKRIKTKFICTED